MSTPINFSIDDKAPASATPKRRGRPPGSTNKPKAAQGATDASTLKQALASLDSLYKVTTLGLTMVGLTDTAETWANRVDDLQKSNEDALKAAPRLAAAIANAGSVGGATAFFAAHVMALAPVMMVARIELAERRATRAAEAAANAPDVTDVPVQDATFIPGI